MSIKTQIDLWFSRNRDEDIRSKVRSLWNSSDDPFVDVVVKVLKCENEEETEFRAHALILGMSSPVLALHLFGDSRLTTTRQGDFQTVLVIKQLHPSIVKMMLEFIYTGSIVLLEETTLAIEKIGGLLFAAKIYNIHKLADFCYQKMEKDLTNEKALANLDRLLDPKSSKNKNIHGKVYEYDKELLKYYLTYILKNGEIILRTDRFKHISVPSLKWICSADFLCATELTVYRAILSCSNYPHSFFLNRWAKEQCEKQKTGPTMKNCRRFLGINDNTLGLMKLVRFSQLDSMSLITKVDRSHQSNCLLTEELVQELYKISVLEEPTDLYCSTPRINNNTDVTKIKQYVEAFVDEHASNTLSHQLVLDVDAGVRSSRMQQMSAEIKMKKYENPVSQTQMVPQCNVDDCPKISNSSRLSQVTNSGNLQYDSKRSRSNVSSIVSKLINNEQETRLLKVVEVVNTSHKARSTESTCKPTSANTTDESMHITTAASLTSFEKKTESPVNNAPLTVRDALDPDCRKRLFVTPPKDFSDLPVTGSSKLTDSSSVSPSPRVVVDDRSKLAIVLEKPTEELLGPSSLTSSQITVLPHSARVNTVTISEDVVNMEFIPPKTPSPVCIDNNSSPLRQHTVSQPTYLTSQSVERKGKASTQLPIPIQSTKTRKRNYQEERSTSQPTKSRKILSQQNNRTNKIKSSHFDEDASKFDRKVISYQDIISDCARESTITKFVLKDSGIREFNKKSCSFRTVYMPHLKKFSVDFNSCDTKTTPALMKELSDINLEHYIFFYVKNAADENRLVELWNHVVNIRLSFCGISVFEMCPNDGRLIINYTKNSSFLRLNELKTNDLKSLSLANCKILQKNWLEPNSCKHLLELRLFKVCTLKCTEVIKDCTNLQHLSIWPSISGRLLLNDLNTSVLVSLAVHNLMIKCDINEHGPFKMLEMICFQDCTWDEKFIENFSMLFPKLRKVFVCSSYSQPGPDLLRILTKMESIQQISLWNFDLKLLEKDEFEDMKRFLRKLGIQKSANQCHFKLKREINGEWIGRNTTLEKQYVQVYEFFGYSKFYTIETWKKIWSVNCM